jgi:hypothetical protein
MGSQKLYLMVNIVMTLRISGLAINLNNAVHSFYLLATSQSARVEVSNGKPLTFSHPALEYPCCLGVVSALPAPNKFGFNHTFLWQKSLACSVTSPVWRFCFPSYVENRLYIYSLKWWRNRATSSDDAPSTQYVTFFAKGQDGNINWNVGIVAVFYCRACSCYCQWCVLVYNTHAQS